MANGTDIAKAYVQIIPSADGIQGNLEKLMGGEADSAGKSAGSKFGNAFSGALKTGGKIMAGMGAAATALTGTLIAGANATAQYGDHIDKMSQKMGISAQAYQEWDAIMQHSGASIDSMQRGMTTLSKAVENGSDAFEALGISQEQLASMSQEEIFAETIKALQGMEEGTERTVLAQELLGGSSKELGALLNTSAEETEAMRQKVHELGGVMSDEAVKAAAAYQDSLQDMKTAFGGLKNNLMGEFLPSMTSVMDGLALLFSGDESGLGKIKEGIQGFADQIRELLPNLIEVGGELVISLTNAIVENLPVLLESAVQAIQTIVEGLLTPDNIILLVNAALDITMALMEGLIDALPLIIQAMTTFITTICERLSNPDSIQRLLKAAWEIIKALAKGLWDAFPQIASALGQVANAMFQVIGQWFSKMLQKGKELVGKIGEGLRSGISNIMSIGRNIVEGIWNGISNALGWIKDKIRGWVGNVMSFLKNLFGIASPSKWARDQIGLNIAKGVGLGFEDGMNDVTKMMAATLPGMSMTFGTSALKSAPAYNYGGVTIQIMGREKDADTLARELQAALERRVAVWA